MAGKSIFVALSYALSSVTWLINIIVLYSLLRDLW